MSDFTETNSAFRARLLDRDPVFGAFVKTPHPIIVEVMAGAGYDFLVLDAEHTPFDRGSLDACIFAGRALGCAMVVRIPAAEPEWISAVLDMGAAGVMVPHVNTAEQAETLTRSMSYGPNGRGFAGTTRAARYADRSMTGHLEATPNEIVLIAQIEDPEGAVNFAEIAAVDGVDALFVGRADLAVGLGLNDFFAPEITAMTQAILGATGAATGLYCAPSEDLTQFAEAGASLFVVGSEHSAIRTAAAEGRAQVTELPKPAPPAPGSAHDT